jgi:CubicO group peptidase (beta-lactamase class C family)
MRFRFLMSASILIVLTLATSVARGDTYADYLNAAYPANGPGAAALVVKNGEVLFRGARGMADLELEVTLSPGHVFRIGSISKQFTAAAIMLLQEQGKLSVDDEITKYLPDYPTHGHTITIEHLLTHTSGIFDYITIPGYMSERIRFDVSTEELIELFSSVAMNFAPGEHCRYSSSGYVLLGAIIEKITGQSYADFIEQSIFTPLGMDNSHYGGLQIVPRRASGYQGVASSLVNAPLLSMTNAHAAGGLLSTIDDLFRWNQALIGGKLLSAESVARMTTELILNNSRRTFYGYGFEIRELRGERTIAHSSYIPGFSGYALWMPDSATYVAVLSNHPDNQVGAKTVAKQMAAQALGEPYPTRVAIELDEETLQAYTGVYTVDRNLSGRVTVEDGSLYTQISGELRNEALAYAKDAFFYENSFAYFTFERDASGTVVRMHMYYDGENPVVAERTADVVARSAAMISPEIYDLWTGSFETVQGEIFVIIRDGDHLIARETGQPAFELHPASKTRYFVKELEAEVEFVAGDDGRARELILYLGGHEIRAQRID